MRSIGTGGNTVAPALLALERLGFDIAVETGTEGPTIRATRGDESYVGEDPVAVLGLVKPVELRGWDWRLSDAQMMDVMRRYNQI